MRNIRHALFPTLALLIASCGQTPMPSAHLSGSSVVVTLASPLAGFGAQGLPTGTDGRSTVTNFHVKVRDAGGQLMKFDGQNTYKAGGTQTDLVMSSTQPTATVVLPRGIYSFETVGKSTEGGTFLAYGTDAGVNLSQGSATVNLSVHALADAAKTTFGDKMQWAWVATQDTLDMRLNVMNSAGTLVPTTDLGIVTYQVVDDQGLPLNGIGDVLAGSSKLGARVKIFGSAATETIFIKATMSAWLVTGTDTAAQSTLSKTFSIPFAKTGLKLDTVAPALSVAPIADTTAGTPVTLSGTVSDDSGSVHSVKVYSGTQLVGSTDATEFVGEVQIGPGVWSLNWTPDVTGTPEVLVIAADRAGNETRMQAAAALTYIRSVDLAGAHFNVAVKQDGTVVGWGGNTYGQTTPPADLTGVKEVAVGDWHSLALKTDGTVVSWGVSNTQGSQYYIGQTDVPADLSGVIGISAGGQHSLALKADGTVVGWGRNDYNQTSGAAGLTDIVSVSAGKNHNLGIKKNGTVVAWGANTYGESNVPNELTDVVSITAGNNRSFAVKRDGTVVSWGEDSYSARTVPASVTGVKSIASGDDFTLALKKDGTVVGWGYNGTGQISIPEGLSGVVAISVGGYHSLAVKSDGSIVGWGDNTDGRATPPAGPYLLP
ncbi:hypothetical protein GCM10010840_14450 [Deinococcus aerolatus]|uniref:Alpha-tubulin suppressor n=1 Tax=Deinococcus aerolatus TaxID=522487 RepID=A0ABQ2G677_9DEIO|nr:RCC1 domain-containing protein [Deinococcus aerolatus]GGL77644.1 hypothetical protein GCM10010840_14450 [Deinococcus aerolatus]